MKILKILDFYRVRDWIKSLGFSILGLSLFVINPFLLFLGLIQACFLFSFLFSFNDFGDYIVHEEKNFIGNLIRKSSLSKEVILLFTLLPVFLSTIPLFLNFSVKYLIFYLLFIILSISYSVPMIRLRDIPYVDVICNTTFFFLIFIQSYFFLNTEFNVKVFFFLFWAAFHSFSHEIIHQISHFLKDKKSGRISTVILIGRRRSIFLLKFIFLIPIMFGVLMFLLFSGLRAFAGIMILFNFIRLFYIRKINMKSNFEKLRNRLWGSFEGGLYFIFNMLSILII